jgi:hypothetical protein
MEWATAGDIAPASDAIPVWQWNPVRQDFALENALRQDCAYGRR